MTQGVLPEPIERALDDDLVSRIDFHRRTILDEPGVIRVITHDDADGICAGGVICGALRKLGKDFHLTSVRGMYDRLIKQIDEEQNELTIVLDMGSSHLDKFEQCAGMTLVMDHHTISSKDGRSVSLLNPHEHDWDGARDVCGSTVAFLVALALDESNWDLVSIAIAGAIGDRQDIGGFVGINQLLLDLAEEKGLVKVERRMDILDDPLALSVPQSLDPYYKRFCYDPAIAREEMKTMGLDPLLKLSELDNVRQETLATLLSTELVSAGIRPESIRLLKKYRVTDVNNGIESRALANIVNACGKMGKNGIGLSIALGDMTLWNEGAKVRDEYRKGIREGLGKLCKEGTKVEGGIQYFMNDDQLRSGEICGLAMLYLVPQDRPLFSIHISNGKCKVSTRGTVYLVNHGLDLSATCREAASHVGGQGGGHVIASGASFPEEGLEEFLENAGRIVKEQLSL